MTGEQLKLKLKSAGISQIEIARLLGVSQQSINQSLDAKDIKTGFLEDLCRVLGKDMSFFYMSASPTLPTAPTDQNIVSLQTELTTLREENERLREELRLHQDPDQPRKESEVYRLWMEYMRIEEKRADFHNRMQELFNNQKEG